MKKILSVIIYLLSLFSLLSVLTAISQGKSESVNNLLTFMLNPSIFINNPIAPLSVAIEVLFYISPIFLFFYIAKKLWNSSASKEIK